MAYPLPVAHLSPTAQSHNRRLCQHCSARWGVLQAALGPIKFMAYFYNLPLCMRPPSHRVASALTVHTAVKFCVSPRFIAARSFEFFICSLSFLIPPCLLTRTPAHVHVRRTCARARSTHMRTCTSTHMRTLRSTRVHVDARTYTNNQTHTHKEQHSAQIVWDRLPL